LPLYATKRISISNVDLRSATATTKTQPQQQQRVGVAVGICIGVGQLADWLTEWGDWLTSCCLLADCCWPSWLGSDCDCKVAICRGGRSRLVHGPAHLQTDNNQKDKFSSVAVAVVAIAIAICFCHWTCSWLWVLLAVRLLADLLYNVHT